MLLSRYDESRARCEEAIAIARSVGARREEGHALNTLGVDLACLGDPDTAVEHLKAARAIAEEVADLDDLARAYLNLAEILAAPLDRIEEAVEVARDGIALCEEVGLDCDYGVSLRAIAAGALFELGRWDEAEAVVADAAERSPIECAAIDFHLAAAKVARRARAARRGRAPPRRRRRADDQHPRPAVHRPVRRPHGRARAVAAPAAGGAGRGADGLGRADDCWYAAPLLWLGIRAAADARRRGDRRAAGRPRARRARPRLTRARRLRRELRGGGHAAARADRTPRRSPPRPGHGTARAGRTRPPTAASAQAEALLEQRQRRAAAKALGAARALAERLGRGAAAGRDGSARQRGRIDHVPAPEAAASRTRPG